MGDPIKPLQALHEKMVQSDLLNEGNRDYNNFAAGLATTEARQRLYEVLKADGKVSVPFEQFESGYFSDYTPPEKKKMVDTSADSGEPSLGEDAPVQDAGIPSEVNPILTDVGFHPLNKPEYGGAQPPVSLSTSNKKLEASLLTNPVRQESTSQPIPIKEMPALDITGKENPMAYGDQHYKENDQGYDYKEKRAAKSPWRAGSRAMDKVTVYAEKAKKQSDFSAFEMREKYGAGWLDEVNRLSNELAAPAASVSPDEITEKQARLNNMTGDPAYQRWLAGVEGQQNSYEEFKAIAKSNPDYVRALASQEWAQKKADESGTFKTASFLAGVTQPVLSGIASLPRTLLGAIGVQDVPVIEQIADWGDRQEEFVKTNTSSGSESSRKLWEEVALFDGMEVQVDENKRPVTAYKNGKKVDMTEDQVRQFEATGAGKQSRSVFTGWENAGWTTAKQLANLYLMRNLGGGTAAGTGATSFTISYNDMYNEAIEQLGYSPTDAAQYAIANATVQGAAEAYLGKIDVAPMKLAAAKAMGVQEAKALAGTISAKEVGKRAGKAMMKEVLGENAEEITSMAGDHIITAAFNAKTGGNIERNFDAQQLAETILLTTATTLLAGGADTPRAARNELRTNALLAATQNPAALQPALQAMVQEGQMTETEAAKATQNVAALAVIEKELPAEMPLEDKAYVLALELDKMQKAEALEGPAAETAKEAIAKDQEIIDAVKDPSTVKEGEPSPIEDAVLPEKNTKKDFVVDINNTNIAPEKKQAMTFDEWEKDALPIMEVGDNKIRNTVYQFPTGTHATLHESGRRTGPKSWAPSEGLMASTGWQLPLGNDHGLSQFGGRLSEDFYAPDGYGTPVFFGDDPLRSAFLWDQWRQGHPDVSAKDPRPPAPVSAGQEAPVAAEPAFEELPQAAVVSEPVSAETVESPTALSWQDILGFAPPSTKDTASPIVEAASMLSPDIQAVMDPADVAIVNEWVTDSLSDPEIMQEYADEATARKELAQEYEEYVLRPKYASKLGQQEVPVDAPAVTHEATQIAQTLDDTQATAVEAFVDKHTRPDGSVDIDSATNDIDNAPEAIKTILNEQEITGSPEQGQRNQETDSPVEGTKGQARQPELDRADRVDDAAAGIQEPTKRRQESIKASMRTAKLPTLDNEVLTELLDDGHISENVVMEAQKYLDGIITAETAKAYNTALNKLGELRKIVPRTALIERDEAQVYRRESDGVLEVSGDWANSFGLQSFGGKWVGAARKWVVPKENAADALAHVVSQLEPIETPATGSLGGSVKAVMSAPGAVVNARRRRTRYKGATSFDERVQIAQAEHGMRATVADPKKVQKMLDRMAKAFPGVEVVHQPAEVEAKMKEIAAAKGLPLEERDGVLGFVVDGKFEAPMAFEVDGVVYVSPKLAHPDAIIHEFGHIWNGWLKANNPEELQRGLDAVRDTDYHEAVKSHPLYADLTEEQQLEEALAHAIGDAGGRMFDMGPLLRFQNWLGDMWREVGRILGIRGPEDYTVEQWANYHAGTLLSGNELTNKPGWQIASEERNADKQRIAVGMENAGEVPEKIYAATGWKRAATGEWAFKQLPVTPRYDTTASFRAGETKPLHDVVTVPALAGTDMMVRIESGVAEPRLDGNTIVMSPVTTPEYLQKVVAVAQSAMTKDVVPGDVPTPRFMAKPTKPQLAAIGSADHAARMQSAKAIIQVELQNEGMKGYEEKARKLSESLGLRLDDVLKVWQAEATEAKHGRFVLALGDAKSLGLGKLGELKEAAGIKTEIVKERLSEWFRRYFTVNGLMPSEVKKLADYRASSTSARLRGARYILADLNKAMKEDYGNPSEGHWRLVDNVLRGEAGWNVLPPNVRSAAVAMRNFTDSLSQELITSGATNGKMVLTILNNAGVVATQENLENWNGMNLFEALNKLPYERTDAEHNAIKDFMARNNKMLGSYFYRSYRKHKDKNWDKKVPPAVLNDAREFLRKEIEHKIAILEEAANRKVEGVEDEIRDTYEAINAVTDNLRISIDQARKEFEAASDAVRHSASPDTALLAAQAAARENLKEWMEKQKDAKSIIAADISIMFDLTEADMNAYADEVWAIVEARKRIADLQEIQDAAVDFNRDHVDNLYRLLSVPYGAKQGGIDGLIRNILAVDDVEGVITQARLGSKDLAFIRPRKDIPVELRDLMGEYHDARLNFATSVVRLIGVVENQQFLTSLRENFAGKYFFPPEQSDMGTQIASRGSASMDPLNGWHATPEVAKALKDHYSPRMDMGPAIGALRHFADMVKYGKTILSPVTHARNFVSNIFFAIQNGYNPKYLRSGASAFNNAWIKTPDDKKRDLIQQYVKLGIVGEGAWSGDLKALCERLNADAVDQMVFSEGYFAQANKWLQRSYQAEDDFWRIVGFETEKARYARSLYGKDFDDLSPEQRNDIERRAADIVSETMPTYSNVPRFAAALREVPLFGTFIAFPAEMFRITANQIKRAVYTDMKDPRTRGIAMTRLAGIAASQSLTVAGAALSKWMIGVGDEEEDSARFFTAEWQKNSMWVWDSFEPGKEMAFRNLAYTDPYAFYKKPIVGLMTDNGTKFEKRMADAAWGLVSPFLDVELTTGTILALAYNRRPGTIEPIYNPGSGILDDWRASGRFAIKQLQPGVVKFAFDIEQAITNEGVDGRPPKQWEDIVLGLAGAQTERVAIEKAVMQRVYASRKSMEWAREMFTRNQYRYTSPEDLDALYERSAAQYNSSLKDLSLCIRNAEVIGIPPHEVNNIVAGPRRGFSKTELNAARAMIVDPTFKLYPKFKGYNKQ